MMATATNQAPGINPWILLKKNLMISVSLKNEHSGQNQNGRYVEHDANYLHIYDDENDYDVYMKIEDILTLELSSDEPEEEEEQEQEEEERPRVVQSTRKDRQKGGLSLSSSVFLLLFLVALITKILGLW